MDTIKKTLKVRFYNEMALVKRKQQENAVPTTTKKPTNNKNIQKNQPTNQQQHTHTQNKQYRIHVNDYKSLQQLRNTKN